MFDVSTLKLELLREVDLQRTFSVVVGGRTLGEVSFASYYEPAIRAIDSRAVLWSGPTLCVIDAQQGSLRCVTRDDETHRVHALEDLWIVEGELTIDLFDPGSATTLATYYHNEVIVDSYLADGLVQIRDFAGAILDLDPRRSLRVVRPETRAAESGADR